jgi:hypothetical protein
MLDVAILDLVGLDFAAARPLVAGSLLPQLQDMNPKGLLWVACDFNARDLAGSGPFILAEEVSRQSGWKLLNIVIRPDFARAARAFSFTDVCEYFLLFVEEIAHRFNKDLVREGHIWQHAEWGKREKNYFPLGKDPGNVWVPTVDDGKGTVIGHAPMNLEETFARCILLAVPRQSEVHRGQTKMQARICTRRPVTPRAIVAILAKNMNGKQETFTKSQGSLARDEARNALISALNNNQPLPLGEFACLVEFDGKTFTCRRASTGEIATSIQSSPKLSTLWTAATGGSDTAIHISKAFNLATATNQAAKVRAAIEGAWVPNEWRVEINAL